LVCFISEILEDDIDEIEKRYHCNAELGSRERMISSGIRRSIIKGRDRSKRQPTSVSRALDENYTELARLANKPTDEKYTLEKQINDLETQIARARVIEIGGEPVTLEVVLRPCS